MLNLSGNKGEWSEVYAFLKLLSTGKLYAADEKLEKIDDTFYDVLEILRQEKETSLGFSKYEDNIIVKDYNSNSLILEMPAHQFESEANYLYSKLTENSKLPSFCIENTERFLGKIGIQKIKADSTDKSDIQIRIHDINSGYNAIQGFSIKSRLGSPSTLINASLATNFTYRIEGSITDDFVEKFNSTKKFKDKFSMFKENGNNLVFESMDNQIFNDNLILMDSDLPRIVASALLVFYSGGKTTVLDVIDEVSKKNPVNYNVSNQHPFYKYKIRALLRESALGMLPSKVWDGKIDATGGYIIVKENGEVLCYHLFNMNDFENYLLENTKFETPSTTRHKFGFIYKRENFYYIKLNLQVRFIK